MGESSLFFHWLLLAVTAMAAIVGGSSTCEKIPDCFVCVQNSDCVFVSLASYKFLCIPSEKIVEFKAIRVYGTHHRCKAVLKSAPPAPILENSSPTEEAFYPATVNPHGFKVDSPNEKKEETVIKNPLPRPPPPDGTFSSGFGARTPFYHTTGFPAPPTTPLTTILATTPHPPVGTFSSVFGAQTPFYLTTDFPAPPITRLAITLPTTLVRPTIFTVTVSPPTIPFTTVMSPIDAAYAIQKYERMKEDEEFPLDASKDSELTCPTNVFVETKEEKTARSMCRTNQLVDRIPNKSGDLNILTAWNYLNPMRNKEKVCKQLLWRKQNCFEKREL